MHRTSERIRTSEYTAVWHTIRVYNTQIGHLRSYEPTQPHYNWSNAKIFVKDDQRTNRRSERPYTSEIKRLTQWTEIRASNQHLVPLVYNPIIHDVAPSSGEYKKHEKHKLDDDCTTSSNSKCSHEFSTFTFGCGITML